MHPNGSHLEVIKSLIEDENIKPIIDNISRFTNPLKGLRQGERVKFLNLRIRHLQVIHQSPNELPIASDGSESSFDDVRAIRLP